MKKCSLFFFLSRSSRIIHHYKHWQTKWQESICCHLSAGFIEASQQVRCPAFSVEANDGLQDFGVFPPVQRLQVIGRHNEKLLLTGDVCKEDNFLGVAWFKQRLHGLWKRRTCRTQINHPGLDPVLLHTSVRQPLPWLCFPPVCISWWPGDSCPDACSSRRYSPAAPS